MRVQFPMTPAGYRKLQETLDHLKRVERPGVIKEIEVARAHGDLSENAEYQYAKEKQSFIEGRILDLEAKVAGAQVIDPVKLSGERVVFGATVSLLDLDTDEEMTYSIVGEDEADIKLNRISVLSPIARGLIGKELGDEVSIRTPKGERSFEIMDLEFVEIS